MTPPVLVVTGGASGLGLAVVKACLDRWPQVRVASLDLSPGLEHERVTNLVVDVTDADQLRVAQASIAEELGTVTMLVANVGAQQHLESRAIAAADWDRLMSVNLTSVLLTCQVFGEQMLARKEGSIVCMSSVAERFGFPRRLPYAVAKAGIAQPVLFLLSSDASFVTGETLYVDGGFSIKKFD